MRIQVASDLHLESLRLGYQEGPPITPNHLADVLVLAGDIGRTADAVSLFANWPMPVIYVMGNHEPYDGCIESVREQLRTAAAGTSVRFIERESVLFGGVRFLGCTLWTDYRLRSNRNQRQLMEHAQLRINDHCRIRTQSGELFSPDHALRDHEISRAWLKQELSQVFDGQTVVISHHAPHPLSIHPRYVGDPTNASFASDLTELLQMADVWLHGHVHDSFDYTVAGCRVVANPRGYALNGYSAPDTRSIRFENASFEPSCVIDLHAR